MKLIPDWKDSWRWFSVWCMTISGAIPAAWLSVPDDMRSAVPSEWMAIGAVVIAVLGIIGRLVDQKP